MSAKEDQWLGSHWEPLAKGDAEFVAVVVVELAMEESRRECWLARKEPRALKAVIDCVEQLGQSRPSRLIRQIRVEQEREWLSAEAAWASGQAGVEMALAVWGPKVEPGPGVAGGNKKPGWRDALVRFLRLVPEPDRRPRALDELRETLERLAQEGLAAGPAELILREDGRLYEADAALACLAMKESWEMRAMAGSGGEIGRARPHRL